MSLQMVTQGIGVQAQQEPMGGISLQYRISRGMPGATGVGAPPLRMESFTFAPIDTPHGLFRMSVDYAPSSTVTILKETTSPGPVAQVRGALACVHHAAPTLVYSHMQDICLTCLSLYLITLRRLHFQAICNCEGVRTIKITILVHAAIDILILNFSRCHLYVCCR